MTQNKLADPSDIGITHSAISTTPAKENFDGFRIRGTAESNTDDARWRQEHDFNEDQNVLEQINLEAAINEVTRHGKYDTNKTRTFLFKAPYPDQRRVILLSARKLQFLGHPSP